ncbi:ATPase [Chitinophaga polysaccharea]|uniref:ATP cone domain-containing protein n=1 Tax=Chitinophaga polysaccharea TaxID=1293035 RepID=UPI001455962C|nr:ATP cone domain-containing protein [Chitinophaga polysaccharea]NLR60354.1 ATPase [Chitinophaga polysaccharea]
MEVKEPDIFVTKSNGEVVPFSPEKIRQSLRKSGATSEMIENIIEELYKQVYPNMPTRIIYKIAYKLLKKASRPAAGRYRLKQAIFELGPSGFPFEQYIAALFRQAGYTVTTNTLMTGHCITHEVDIYAVKNKGAFIIECKYHQLQGTHCDVKIPLYVQSRFRDIAWKMKEGNIGNGQDYRGWLITNTRITPDGIQYGVCMGLNMLSWDYPTGKGLKDVIDRSGLYPVTCLSTLSRHEKYMLLEQGVVLCRSLLEKPDLLSAANIRGARLEAAMMEVQHLCEHILKVEWV